MFFCNYSKGFVMSQSILKVQDLSVSFQTETGFVTAVDSVSFSLKREETLGIVGESGCGKTVTALALMRLLPHPASRINSGEIIFDGKNILNLPVEKMFQIRGRKIAMIFQEPMTALNPVKTIGRQIAEVYHLHFPQMSSVEITKSSVEMLARVGIPLPDMRLKEYPYQLSGGMRQRVMIAMALAGKPEILIADEPTTALDVTIQSQILDLIEDLQREIGMSIILITHNLGMLAQICDRVLVMYAGQIAEKAKVIDLFKNPRHPYTLGLLHCLPQLDYPSKLPLKTIKGMVSSLMDMPKGCRFQNRCPYVEQKCRLKPPPLEICASEHETACYRWKEVKAG